MSKKLFLLRILNTRVFYWNSIEFSCNKKTGLPIKNIWKADSSKERRKAKCLPIKVPGFKINYFPRFCFFSLLGWLLIFCSPIQAKIHFKILKTYLSDEIQCALWAWDWLAFPLHRTMWTSSILCFQSNKKGQNGVMQWSDEN